MKSFSKISHLSLLAVFVLILVGTLSFGNIGQAQSSQPVFGRAWSDNIGWISMSRTASSGAPFGVMKEASGNLTGYAWSDSIGWIQFNPAGPYPIATGNNQTPARVDSDVLSGWARACGGQNDQNITPPNPLNQTAPNNSCTGSSRTDGWDGWISLKGTHSAPNFSYGVSLADAASIADSEYNCLKDCVWGSDVVGWTDFSGVSMTQSSQLDFYLNRVSNVTILEGTPTALGSVKSFLVNGNPSSTEFDPISMSNASSGANIPQFSWDIKSGGEVPVTGGTLTTFNLKGLGGLSPGTTYTVHVNQSVTDATTAETLAKGTTFDVIVSGPACGVNVQGNYATGAEFPRGNYCDVGDLDPSSPLPSLGAATSSTVSWDCKVISTVTCNAERKDSVGTCTEPIPIGSGVLKSTIPPAIATQWFNNGTSADTACEWTCQPGYSRLGSENKCRPIPGWEEF